MKKSTKIVSGALQLSLFISVIVALLLTGLILYAQTFAYLRNQTTGSVRHIQQTDSGIAYLLNNRTAFNDTVSLLSPEVTVKMNRAQWGIFEKIYSESRFRTKIFCKIGLSGTISPNETSPVLYLQENNMPLAMVGYASINGLAYLPKSGAKAGYVAGHGFYQSKLVNGEIRVSSEQLPPLDPTILKGISSYLAQSQSNLKLFDGKNHENSFRNQVRIYLLKEGLLQNCKLTGNIMIVAPDKLVVEKDCELKEVVLVAKNIEIAANTHGRFQAIASESIVVGKDCKLRYPSSLVVMSDNQKRTDLHKLNQAPVMIHPGVEIDGNICFLDPHGVADYNPKIAISEKSRVLGQVYCEGALELKGEVYGTVYTRNFITTIAGSSHINHLFNCTIGHDVRIGKTAGLPFTEGTNTVLKWLH